MQQLIRNLENNFFYLSKLIDINEIIESQANEIIFKDYLNNAMCSMLVLIKSFITFLAQITNKD